jgi:hypothetical protein
MPQCPVDLNAVVNLWKSVTPPLSLRAESQEGPSEIDVAIETASWVWFIEAKYKSDISTRTKTRTDRDQIIRNIDVGSHYAGVRQFFFSLLISSEARSPKGAKRIREYRDLSVPKAKCAAHRPDGLSNVQAVSQLTWNDLHEVLKEAFDKAEREDEREYARRAGDWLVARELVDIPA